MKVYMGFSRSISYLWEYRVSSTDSFICTTSIFFWPVFHCIRCDQLCSHDTNLSQQCMSWKVVTTDEMAFVKNVDIKPSQLNRCCEFAEYFINIIKEEIREYNKVRIIVFDRYGPKTMKSNTRASLTQMLLFVH